MDAPTVMSPETHVDFVDMRRRIKAIFIGSMGNLVEWYDFYAYAAFSLVFRRGVLSRQRSCRAAAQCRGAFRRRILGAADRWLALRPPRRSLWPPHGTDDFGRYHVFRLADDCGDADLCLDRHHGAGDPLDRAHRAGLKPGRRIRNECDLSQRSRRPAPPRLLFELPIRDLDWGQLSALLVLLLLQKVFLTGDEIKAWGWRIPFAIGALLAVVAAIMRRELQETDAFEAAKKAGSTRESSLKALLQYPREVLLVVGLTLGGTAAFYTYTRYMQTFLKLSVGLDEDTTTLVAAGSLIFAMILQPLYGYVSDHIGRRPVLTWFGVCGVIFTYPLLSGIQGTKSAFGAFCLICFAWIIVAGYTSINAIVKAELFPTKIRATGVGLPYALTVSIFGGSAPAVALAFKNAGHETWFYFYLTAAIFISLIIYVTMRDTKKDSAMERHV